MIEQRSLRVAPSAGAAATRLAAAVSLALLAAACSPDSGLPPGLVPGSDAAYAAKGGNPAARVIVSVVVTPNPATVRVDATQQLTATAYNRDGGVVPAAVFKWSSSDTTSATVSASGVVLGRRAGGPVTITAKTDMKSAAATVRGMAQVTVESRQLQWVVVPSPTTQPLYAVWGAAPHDVWAVGEYGTILHYDGAQWTSVANTISRSLVRVWGASSTDIWATAYTVGGGGYAVYHYDGSQWTQSTSVGNGGVWGTASNNVWVGGDGGFLMRFDGAQWSTVSSPFNGAIDDFSGTSASDVWAVGDAGGGIATMHYDGNSWTAVPTPPVQRLGTVWAASAADVWAGGYKGSPAQPVMLRWNGSTWSEVPPPSLGGACCVHQLWGSAANSVWGTSSGGQILHFDGTQWSVEGTSTTSTLASIWGFGDDDVWAVGDGGVILHRTYVP